MKRPLLASMAAVGSLIFVLGTAYAAPQPEQGYGLPRDASLDGWRIDRLLMSTGVLTGILFVIMCIWMGIAMVKHRQGMHKAEYDHGVGAKHAKAAILISSLIFFVVDGNLYINSMIDLGEAYWRFPDASANAVRVQVNAQQWAWNFRLAGTDGEFNTADDIVTLNELRVPKGRPVHFQLAAKDVIHSLYFPNLRIKQDAVPGNITQMWFHATQTGEFDIGCAQHCGTHHYKMKGHLVILEPGDFQQWADHASALSARGFDKDDKDAQWGWAWGQI